AALKGSGERCTATATRELAAAKVDGRPVTPQGATLTSPTTVVEGNRQVEFQWQDQFRLGGKEPFVLTINGLEDEAPSLMCDGLPSREVGLGSGQIRFKVTAPHGDRRPPR